MVMRLRGEAGCNWDLKETMLSFNPACQSADRFPPHHRPMKERSEIAPCNVCPLCLYLFISFLLLALTCVPVHKSACVWEDACLLACGYTPLPTGLCDHIPADMPFRSLVTSAGVSKWQGLFVCVLICSEETGADSRRRQEEGSHNKFPPRTTQNVILPLAAARAQPSCWKEQTFKTLWHVSQALPLSQCHWWSWNWQAPSHRSWLGDTPSLVCVTSYPRQGRIPSCHTNTNCIMGWAGSAEAGWHMLDMRLCACEGMNGMPGIMDSRLIKVWATDLPVGNALFDPELSHCRCSLGTSWLNKWHATSSEQISDILL